MNSSRCQCKADIRAAALRLGADVCGFARAEAVDADAIASYDGWLSQGKHGSMDYCARYREQRSDPCLLLDGAKTVISCAFSYYTGPCDMSLSQHISRYAWGGDYHWAVKSRLKALGDYVTEKYGGQYRVCVDSAPIRERYWAVKAGVGFIGRNNQLIVPDHGSFFFLGELLWTGEVEPDAPCTDTCSGCMECVRSCPGGALDGDTACDSRRCISYLTIENRGDLPEDANLAGSIYGCDICQRVCVHNRTPLPTRIDEFKPDPAILSLTAEQLQEMTSSQWRKKTAHSAMSRVPLKQLLRNLIKVKGKG